jgi:FtsH-binding integral membrane protein
VLMVGFAMAAILYDTSQIMTNFSKDQYVAASLSLFSSVALLFWYVLRIVMDMRR